MFDVDRGLLLLFGIGARPLRGRGFIACGPFLLGFQEAGSGGVSSLAQSFGDAAKILRGIRTAVLQIDSGGWLDCGITISPVVT
jgi:hypothetical protein